MLNLNLSREAFLVVRVDKVLESDFLDEPGLVDTEELFGEIGSCQDQNTSTPVPLALEA